MSEENITPDKLTKAYIKIRAERSALSAQFKEESVRTSEGLFFRSKKTKYWTSDWDAMHTFIKEHNVPELLDKRLNQTNIKQFLEENPTLVPDSLNTETELVISVRKK